MYRLFGVFLLIVAVTAKHEIYDGHSLFEVSVSSIEEAKMLNVLENELNLDVWSNALPSRPGLVLVPKDAKDNFEAKLKVADIKYRVDVENIKDVLEQEDRMFEKVKTSTAHNASRTSLPFDRVYTYDEIDAYIELLGETYPNVVTVVNAGNSVEGRPIKYLKISTTNFQDNTKPIVFMESLLHAREWLTQSATLYAIHKLVIDVTENEYINDIDWIILPVANPDGFVHTHDDYRFWRKNRATGYMIANICSGVDLNRNFDVMWSSASSNLVCSDTFHGSRGFSEPETQIVGNIINEYRDRMELFLDIHSFGSWILYGYGDGNLPSNGLIVHLVGIQMAHAIDAVKLPDNPDYIVGNVAMLLYPASGSAADYAMHVGVPLAYTYELPAYTPGSATLTGFLVDPDFIEQAGFETWQGIKAGAIYARNNYRMRNGL